MFLGMTSIQYVNMLFQIQYCSILITAEFIHYRPILPKGLLELPHFGFSLVLGLEMIHSVMKSHSLISKLFHTYVFVQGGK